MLIHHQRLFGIIFWPWAPQPPRFASKCPVLALEVDLVGLLLSRRLERFI